MIVCSCNVLSDHDIRAAAGSGAVIRTVGDVYRTLGGCDGQCRRCARSIKAVLDEVKGADCDECLAVCGQRVTDTSHPPHHPVSGPDRVALLQAAE